MFLQRNQLQTFVRKSSVAYNIIGSCGACWRNFLSFWCEFTCSPNQSQFLQVTDQQDGRVKRVDYHLSPEFGTKFYDSCKSVKFGPNNAFAMDLIGNGASNYLDMVRFMGHQGPFPIDFPKPAINASLSMNIDAVSCNSTDLRYRCSCVDCDDSCPNLGPVAAPEICRFFGFPCWFIISLAIWIVFWLVLGVKGVFQIVSQRRKVDLRLSRAIQPDDSDFADETASILSRSTVSYSEFNSEENINEQEQNAFFVKKCRRSAFHGWLQAVFWELGMRCARFPWLTVLISFCFVLIASYGCSNIEIESEPLNLWVARESETALQKQFFDSRFEPFYRTELLMFTSVQEEKPIINYANVHQVFRMISDIQSLSAGNHTLDSFCLKPLGNGVCVIQSIAGYWQNNMERFESETNIFEQKFKDCTNKPSDCLPEFLQPIKPSMVLGGYEHDDYWNSKAMFVTFVLNNNPENQVTVERWEDAFISYVTSSEVQNRLLELGLKLSFSTENSIKREISRESMADAGTIALSYFVMFLYASLALGQYSSFKRLYIDSKMTIGMCGIIIVIASITSAIGIYSLFKFKVSMIILEVIPFLVLAIGVDNIFIIVHEFNRITMIQFQNTGMVTTPAERTAITISKIGPSLLMSAISETLVFGLGSFVTMPAVRSFSLVAALAVWLNFCLQITCFVALMTLDAQRSEVIPV